MTAPEIELEDYKGEEGEHEPTIDEIKQAILTQLSVPLWPHTGVALGMGRGATYDAAKRRGDKAPQIPVLPGSRLKYVPTSWLRTVLGLKAA